MILDTTPESAATVHGVPSREAERFVSGLGGAHAAFAAANGFEGGSSQLLALPDPSGAISDVLIGTGDGSDPFALAALAKLPGGDFALGSGWPDPSASALGLLLGLYRFDNYRKPKARSIRLAPPEGVDVSDTRRIADAVYLARDLINTPANDLGPAEIADAAQALARKYGAAVSIVDGEELEAGFPMVVAVGAASSRPPLLIDLTWGEPDAPKVTLVGKGIVFDTGGLNIKPERAMSLMKKDMGGAAQAIALAQLVMDAALPVRLRLLVPSAENAIGGAAFRPGDVLRSRKGLSVEIGNTDAEGRLLLADALAYADQESTDLMIDFATLTGAARVALGPELPALFTASDPFADAIRIAGEDVHDPLWRLPLWPSYERWLKSPIADVSHISSQPFGGAITAALFLKRFVERAATYAHFDVYAWNAEDRPGRPKGGEAQTVRALYHWLKLQYAP